MKQWHGILLAAGIMLVLGCGSGTATDFDLLPPPAQADFSPYRMTVPLEPPLASLKVNSPFGWRFHPISGELDFHTGTDLAAGEGEAIKAVLAGLVETAGYDESYGNYLVIDHFNGFTSLYAHCSRLLVQAGDRVRRGEIVAKVGATGDATGPHLHLELRMKGIWLNPAGALGLYD